MEPRLIDENGEPVPAIVPDLETQIKELFEGLMDLAALDAEASASLVRTLGWDNRSSEDNEDEESCAECSAPVNWVNEDGVCGNCAWRQHNVSRSWRYPLPGTEDD